MCFALSFRRVYWAVLKSDVMLYRVFSMFVFLFKRFGLLLCRTSRRETSGKKFGCPFAFLNARMCVYMFANAGKVSVFKSVFFFPNSE